MRKVTLIVLALFLVLTVVACTAGPSQTTAPTGTTAPTTAGTTVPAETIELLMAFQGTPQAHQPDVEAGISAITKPAINVTLKLLIVEPAAYNNQINLMLSSNEQLDILYAQGNQVPGYIQRGQILSMEGLIQSEAPAVLDLFGDLIDATKVNGEIYGIPTFKDMAFEYGVTMRKDLVDKYKIDLNAIKTWTDIEPILAMIKEKEPDLNPLIHPRVTADMGALNYLFQPWDDFGVIGTGIDFSGDMKVKILYETDKYKDLTQLARKWYTAGYIIGDAATSTESRGSLFKAGKAFAVLAKTKPGFDTQESLTAGTELITVNLTGPFQFTTSINNAQYVLPRNVADEKRAMQFYNMLYTNADIQNLLCWGIEGKDYEVKSDGRIGYPAGVDSKTSGWNLNGGWYMGNQFLSYVWERDAKTLWDDMKTFNTTATKSPAFGFIYDTSGVKNEITAVVNVVNQYTRLLECGAVDPTEILPKFISELKSAGIDKIVADKQKQLDAWAADN